MSDPVKPNQPPALLLWDYSTLPSSPEARARRLILTFPYSFRQFRPEDIRYVEAHKKRLFKDPCMLVLWDHMKRHLFDDYDAVVGSPDKTGG